MPDRYSADHSHVLLETKKGQEGMSYGAPGEQGVGEADTTPLLSLGEPGLVPGASGSNRGAKRALKARYQRKKRRRLRKEAAARKMRCENDQDNCMGMMTEMIEVLRGYESYQKVIRTADEASSKSINEVGKV